jgi:hypothetical protein
VEETAGEFIIRQEGNPTLWRRSEQFHEFGLHLTFLLRFVAKRASEGRHKKTRAMGRAN